MMKDIDKVSKVKMKVIVVYLVNITICRKNINEYYVYNH